MKKTNKSAVVVVIALSICLMGIIGILIWDLISKIKRGWNNNDSITLIFFAIIALVGPVVIKSFHDYFINHNRKVIILNNDIYRLFTKMEENKTITNFEKHLIESDQKRYLEAINRIARKRNKEILITRDNINEYFGKTSGIYKGEVNLIDSFRLTSIYEKIKSNKSFAYEKLYKSVHNGELIKNSKFPLFEFIIPLLLAFTGLFATIYQSLSVDNSIKEPLMEYFKLFGTTILWALAYALFTYRSFKEGTINSKANLLTDLELSDES